MRFSQSLQMIFGLAPFLINASTLAGDDIAPPAFGRGLTEEVEKRLIQFEVRLTRKGVPISGLTANEIDIELGGRPLRTFTLDDMCQASTVSTSAKRLGSSILYFDEPELTVEGRHRAIEVARLLATNLLAHNHDLLIVRNGKSVRAETTWTHDADEVSAALDRIESDPGHMDYLRDAADEARVQQMVEQANDTLVSNHMEDDNETRQLGTYGCGKVRRVADTTSDATIVGGLAGELRTVVNQELQRGGRDIERLRDAVRLLSTRGAPKEIIYFADSLRGDPGRIFKQFLGSVTAASRSKIDSRVGSTLTAWNSDGAIQALVTEASTYGVRFYAVEGRGLAERNDWIRTAQDTLISIALDTGGLSFVNGLNPSIIVDRINRDQSCWYLVSFDPKGWEEDRTYSVGVYGKQPGLRALTSSSLVIPSRTVLAQARLVASHFGDPAREDQPLPISIYPVGGTSKRLQVMAQVRLPEDRPPEARESTWDIGFDVVSQGAVIQRTSSRAIWRGGSQGLVCQTTLSLPSGPYEILAVARNVSTDSTHRGRLEGTWPASGAERVALSEPALAQPQRSGVVVDGEVNPHGIVVRGAGDVVDPRQPAVIVTAVCIDGHLVSELRAERSIRGSSEVSFDPMRLSSDEGRCVQIRDVITKDALEVGELTYRMRVFAGETLVASQDLLLNVAEDSTESSRTIASAPN